MFEENLKQLESKKLEVEQLRTKYEGRTNKEQELRAKIAELQTKLQLVQDENARLIGGGSERCTLGVRFISLIRLSSVADLTKGACPGAASAGAHARALTRSRLHAHLHHELESGPRREVPLLALLGEEQGGSSRT